PEEVRLLRRKIHSLGMEECVLICGYLSPVYPLYKVASLMVMPSIWESFGMAAVEAAACGVPVMASNAGGLSSIIHHERTGILLPPDDRQAWLEALSASLSAPARFAEMAAMARRDVMRRFSMESTIDGLLSLGGARRL
ncbi:glycosyltransferase, partial [Escherichia coli]